MSRKVSPEHPGSSNSSQRSSSIPRVARVETSSSLGSHAEKLAALKEYWANQKFEPDQTINPSHFSENTSGVRKSASVSSLRPAPERTPRPYGGVSTAPRHDPRQSSPPRNGLETIHNHFGGPSRQGTGDTSAATIASLPDRDPNRPTAVLLARGKSPAPQIQDFQKPYMLPSAPPRTTDTLRGPRNLAQPAIPSRTASDNNARPARPGHPRYQEQAPLGGGRHDGRNRRRSSTSLRPPELGRRSRSANDTLTSARELGRDLLNAGRQVWDDGLLNVLGSGNSSRDSSHGRNNSRRR